MGNATSVIQSFEQKKYEMFIQLVTQCFQLSIRMKEDDLFMRKRHQDGKSADQRAFVMKS